MKRIPILDALRILLALSVVIGHLGMFPLFGPVGVSSGWLDFLARGWRTAFFGPAAVVAFFVISGFCIHYPFVARHESCPVARFYGRRYLRIGIPVLCAVALLKFANPSLALWGENAVFWNSTLWSIVCEEVYYAVYPLLNRLAPTAGWSAIIGANLLVSLFLCWHFFPATNWEDIGIIPTTIVLFPVWLLGCYLAENIQSARAIPSPATIWVIRSGAWAVMWLALVLHFHTVIHQTVSALGVGLACYFWIRAEICHSREHKPWPLLVWGGHWSYSLYLIHPLVIDILAPRISANTRLGWLAVFILILAVSYIFYLLVERPSHRLARRIRLWPGENVSPAPSPQEVQ